MLNLDFLKIQIQKTDERHNRNCSIKDLPWLLCLQITGKVKKIFKKIEGYVRICNAYTKSR